MLEEVEMMEIPEMGNCKRFKFFDPLSGLFEGWEFPRGFSVVYRARSLLSGRTPEQIEEIAENIDQIISSYFDSEEDYFIRQIQQDGRYELLEGSKERVIGLKPEAVDVYGIKTSYNTSDLDALQDAMSQFFDPAVLDGIEDLHEYEYFAVQALLYVNDFVEKIKTEFVFSKMKQVKRRDRRLNGTDTATAARCLIDAMEAVCYAERLREIERTQERYEQQIEKIQSSHKLITIEDQARIRGEARRELEAEAKAARVAQAKERGKLAHRESYEAKKFVLEMWEKNPTQFRSAEKAGAYYVDVLDGRGIEREHRTVVGWIRTRAKELGIRFR